MKTTSRKTTNFLPRYRRIPILPFILGLLCVASCSNKGGALNSNDPIVGTWKMESFNWKTTSTTEEVTTTITAKGKDIDDIMVTFHPDGTMSTSGSTFTVVYTMEMGGYSSTKEIETKSPIPTGTWKRKGDMLIGDYPGNKLGPQEIMIVSLEDDKMHLGITTKPPIPVPGMGDLSIDVYYTRVD